MTARRFSLLVRRILRARKFGVWFTGTTTFRIPKSVRLCGRQMPISLLDEREPSLDFINVALDDEYGLRSLPLEPKTILDVGANCGLFSLLARHHHPSATIHAYEPNPRVFVHAARNLATVNVKLFNEGIGSRAGRATMHDKGEARLGRTQLGSEGDISITALADAVDRLGQVDLLKLDCEGAEWDIFQDVPAFAKVACIRMEYHLSDGKTIDDLRAFADKAGFKIDRLVLETGFGIAWLSRPPAIVSP